MRLIVSFIMFFAFWATSLQAQKPITTEHGYRFVLHQNKGGMQPRRGETVIANVYVWVGDTLMSDSHNTQMGVYRYDLPDSSAQLSHVPPIMDAFLLMGKGDSATIYQNIDDKMRDFIPKRFAKETEIRFDILLIDIISLEAKKKAQQDVKIAADKIRDRCQTTIQSYRSGLLNQQIQTLPSGLKLYVDIPGKGPKVEAGELMKVHYYGFLADGTPFDNSFERRERLSFPAGGGQMIAGFDEGVLNLNHGTKAYLFIPANLAYGEQGGGPIPPNADLVYYIDVL
ncbi:MAG: FKBP-type peptidyl-prolyl cis-trans isomerase [Saprospiraceae bacterium]|nr:FKBP-type peptidyl-prolyl cis-trans isomerase [Saprospiraceae bacterium]